MRSIARPLRDHARGVALVVAVFAVVNTTLMLLLSSLNGTLEVSLGEQLGLIVGFYVYLLVGLVLVVKRPENPLSWVVLGVGVLPTFGAGLQEYAHYAIVVRPEMPGDVPAALFNQVWWFVNLAGVFVFVPLLFPTGHAPSPRWRWLVRFAMASLVTICVVAALDPVLEGQTGYRLANPIGVAWGGEGGPAGGVIFIALVLCMLATLVSLPIRFRRARGIERQQMKWFVFAGLWTIGLPLLEFVGFAPWWTEGILFDVALCLPPLAIGVAVLRYRLYDIDRLVSRTLTYAVLTAAVVGLYLLAVTTLTALTAPVTGESPLAVAAATLVAAAAFGPLRRRLQTGMDRRFNRARYNAAQTVDAFRATLRDEVDLSAITGQVQSVVDRTVQPTRTVVWLRSEATS